jgi:hypothetical protein
MDPAEMKEKTTRRDNRWARSIRIWVVLFSGFLTSRSVVRGTPFQQVPEIPVQIFKDGDRSI